MSCIHSAALGGHYHVVEFILSNGCKSVNLRDEDDETPLHLASKMGFINIVNLLMDNGADQALKNKDGVTAAMWAMTESQVDVVELLLDRAQRSGGKELAAVVNACDKDGDSLLMVAASGGHSRIVNDILDMGTGAIDQQNADGDTALILASREGCTEVVRLLLLFGSHPVLVNLQGDSALTVAARENNVGVARLLVLDGANINSGNKLGDTPLIVACKHGSAEVAKVLLSHRASLTTCNKVHLTPLVAAIQAGHAGVALLVAEHTSDACDFNRKTLGGLSALHCAYQNKLFQVAHVLISKGALVDITDQNEETLLHKATRDDNVEVMQYLILNGSDITRKNKEGETPLMTATTSAAITFLLAHGAEREDVNNEGLSLATLAWIAGRIDMVNALIN